MSAITIINELFDVAWLITLLVFLILIWRTERHNDRRDGPAYHTRAVWLYQGIDGVCGKLYVFA